jgi:hypothetical protein
MATRFPRALTKKRNALAYEFNQLEARTVQVRQELAALDYTTRLLDPIWKAPRKAHKPMISRGLRHRDIARTCLSILRDMPGLAAPVLADYVAEERGVRLTTQTEREDRIVGGHGTTPLRAKRPARDFGQTSIHRRSQLALVRSGRRQLQCY